MSRKLWLVASLMLGCYPITDAVAAESYDGSLESFDKFISENKQHLEGWTPPAVISTALMRDGKSLRYARWDPATDEKRRGTVVFFSGRTEFIERNTRTYSDLAHAGWVVWTFDWRGQGLSDGRLAEDADDPLTQGRFFRGHIDSFDTYVGDAQEFIHTVVMAKEQRRPYVLLAHSMGGQIALRYLESNQADFNAIVLTSPLVELSMGWIGKFAEATKDALGITQPCVLDLNDIFSLEKSGQWHTSFSGTACEALPAPSRAILKDTEMTQRYTHDSGNLAAGECLIERSLMGGAGPGLAVTCPTAGWLVAAKESTDQVLAHSNTLSTPIMIVAAENDSIVDPAAQKKLCDKLKDNCALVRVKSAGHEILIERSDIRQAFLRLFDEFTAACGSPGKICRDTIQSIK